MRCSFAFLAAALVPLISAQRLFEVAVGQGDALLFQPESVQAAVGDSVMFVFYPKNHSVVQSTFEAPCVRKPVNGSSPAGIYSGFMPTAANASLLSTYTIRINDTKPLWFYCSQGQHCKNGMSMVVNPPDSTEKTLINYKAVAAGSLVTPSAAANGAVGPEASSTSPVLSASSSNVTTNSRIISTGDSTALKTSIMGTLLSVMVMCF